MWNHWLLKTCEILVLVVLPHISLLSWKKIYSEPGFDRYLSSPDTPCSSSNESIHHHTYLASILKIVLWECFNHIQTPQNLLKSTPHFLSIWLCVGFLYNYVFILTLILIGDAQLFIGMFDLPGSTFLKKTVFASLAVDNCQEFHG